MTLYQETRAPTHHQWGQTILKYLDDLHKDLHSKRLSDLENWKIFLATSSQQLNGHDGGMFICWAMLHRTLALRLDYTQETISDGARCWMALALLKLSSVRSSVSSIPIAEVDQVESVSNGDPTLLPTGSPTSALASLKDNSTSTSSYGPARQKVHLDLGALKACKKLE